MVPQSKGVTTVTLNRTSSPLPLLSPSSVLDPYSLKWYLSPCPTIFVLKRPLKSAVVHPLQITTLETKSYTSKCTNPSWCPESKRLYFLRIITSNKI